MGVLSIPAWQWLHISSAVSKCEQGLTWQPCLAESPGVQPLQVPAGDTMGWGHMRLQSRHLLLNKEHANESETLVRQEQ